MSVSSSGLSGLDWTDIREIEAARGNVEIDEDYDALVLFGFFAN